MVSYLLGTKSLTLPFLSLLFCLLSYGVLASKILNSLAPPSEEEFTGSVDGSNLKNESATLQPFAKRLAVPDLGDLKTNKTKQTLL